MLSFLRRTLGRRSIRKHAEKTRLREAQRAVTHIPASGDAKSVITCRVCLLDGTDVSVDLPVRALCVCALRCIRQRLVVMNWMFSTGRIVGMWKKMNLAIVKSAGKSS